MTTRPSWPRAIAAIARALGDVAATTVRNHRSREARRAVLSETLPLAAVAEHHQHKVNRICGELRARTATTPLSLRKSGPPHQVPKHGDLRRADAKLDVTDLTQILDIDPVQRTCVAEAGVAFVDLVEATLRHGLVPIVVPELKTITIGGAVAGCSIESMSFAHGGFHDTCLEYEVITADGNALVCTPTNEHALVFQMIHGSFGTLGILTRLTFKLVPARAFVKLTYETHATLAAYQAAIRSHTDAHDVDFIDGIIHAPDRYVLCLGEFVDRAPYTHRYDWVTVFWQTTAKRRDDYMTTADYFFRYDRGVTNVRPQSLVGRALFGKLVSSDQLLRLADQLPWILEPDRPTITLDVFVPFSKVPEFMAWYERELGFFPLWCVPYRRVRDYEWLAPAVYAGNHDDLYLDLAIYGMPQLGDKPYHRMMEEKLRELGGIKTLIAHNYYPHDEFWTIWNRANYDAVKAITDPHNIFRDLYTKTCKTQMGVA